jgi:hypothetical protein
VSGLPDVTIREPLSSLPVPPPPGDHEQRRDHLERAGFRMLGVRQFMRLPVVPVQSRL